MIDFNTASLQIGFNEKDIEKLYNLRNLKKSCSVKKQMENLSKEFLDIFSIDEPNNRRSKGANNYKNDENKNSSKSYMIHKIDLKDETEIKELIEKQFSDPNNFLTVDENIRIGKSAFGASNLKDLSSIKPYHIIGDPKIFQPKKKLSLFRKGTTNNKKKVDNSQSVFSRLLSDFVITNPQKNQEMKIELLTDQKIENLFDYKKKLVMENKQKDQELYHNIEHNYQTHVKNILKKQENVLNNRTKVEKEVSNLAKYLALKTQKPEEKLLINRTEGFRLKNEIKNIIEEKGSKQTKYGFQNDWIISLRKTPGRKPLYSSENRNSSTSNSISNIMNIDFNPLKTQNFDYLSTQSIFNKSGSNFLKTNFNNSSDSKFSYLKYHKTPDNDMWVTIKNDVNPDDFDNKNFNNYQIRKPNTDPISVLDNFTRCQSVEDRFQNLRIKKEDFNKINNMKIEGNNLLEFEKDHSKKLTGVKILWRYPDEKNLEKDCFYESYNYNQLIKQTKFK